MSKPEQKKEVREGLLLPVMEHFYTLQGEGANSGKAAYFIRLGGCDVGCHWCDVKESWSFDAHPYIPVEELANMAADSGTPNVVITGGEPSLHNLGPLIATLKERNLSIWVETAGTSPITTLPDWICLSPKKFKAPMQEWLAVANELKVVIFHPTDIEWALSFEKSIPEKCIRILQPEWGRSEKVLPHIIEFIKANPRWQISLQTHKYMQIP
jgi:7-carboxy-7-deazaguanine synthase